MAEKKPRGGARKGAGRPSRGDEDKAKDLLRTALKELYKKTDDTEATIAFLKEFVQTPRGQQFTAEHLLGKPKEQVENTLIMENIKPIEWVGSK